MGRGNRITWLASLLLLPVSTSPVCGQWYGAHARPPYGYGGVYAPYAGPGGYMAGQADVISSTGQFQNQQQQAQITHQKALQEQIKTKKMEFDWKQYEVANTPTFSDNQINWKNEKTRRIFYDPTDGEITSGEALNLLLPYLESLSNKGLHGPPIPLSPSVVDKINVTTSASAGSAGVLEDPTHISFPIVLRGETQMALSDQLATGVSMAVNGTLDFDDYQQIRATLDKLTEEHKKKFHEEKIDGGSYLIGKRFLDSLEKSVKVLEQPDAAEFFDGTYKAQGGNVQELVHNMTKQGLRFAPALSGDEPAYFSLHNSMVTYVSAGSSAAGFQAQLSPEHMKGFGKNMMK